MFFADAPADWLILGGEDPHFWWADILDYAGAHADAHFLADAYFLWEGDPLTHYLVGLMLMLCINAAEAFDTPSLVQYDAQGMILLTSISCAVGAFCPEFWSYSVSRFTQTYSL